MPRMNVFTGDRLAFIAPSSTTFAYIDLGALSSGISLVDASMVWPPLTFRPRWFDATDDFDV